MKDKEFKDFKHVIRNGYIIKTKGEQLTKGYNPDLSIADQHGNIIYIVENERKSDRKAFLGDLIKAAYFCEQSNYSSTLIIVMKENGNQTTVKQISSHLKDYYAWFRKLGVSKLNEVLIISDEEYIISQKAKEAIGSTEFLNKCIPLSKL